MKIRFFGDSWCWSWYPKVSLKSKRLAPFNGRFPSIEWQLSKLGIDTEVHARPANTLVHTTDTILSTKDNTDVTYNVVMISSPYRRNSTIDQCDVSDYDKFMHKWNHTIVDCLTQIQKWGEENNQQIFLVGGQCSLPKELFDLVENKSNIHLLSECIISDVVNADNITKIPRLGMFRLCDFTDKISTKYDKRLVDHIYEDMNTLDKRYGYVGHMLFWPDASHLNFAATLILIDKILYKIEQLEGESK